MMKTNWRVCLVLICACLFTTSELHAQKINAASQRSIAEALQRHLNNHPSVFPLEACEGGVQNVATGMQSIYFGYGERRYSDHTDFHPAMDIGYFPRQTGDVKTADGKTWKVRSPQSYLKKIYAIQKGLLVSAAKNISGYKIILQHRVETPYFDDQGRAYHEYFTSYRHVDSRSLDYLTGLAKKETGNEQASVQDITGKHVFEAGELIGFAGFNPNSKIVLPRAHLDFSLHVFADPKKGANIRNYSINPLLLFPAFDYGNPRAHQIEDTGVPAYRLVINQDTIVAPTNNKDGKFRIEIHAGGFSADGAWMVTRYYALNAMHVTVQNDGGKLADFVLDRQQKQGYDASSYNALDNPDTSRPYFDAPLDEQGDVFLVDAVLPSTWFGDLQYDWSQSGSVFVKVSSVWDGYLDGHYTMIEIPMAVEQ